MFFIGTQCIISCTGAVSVRRKLHLQFGCCIITLQYENEAIERGHEMLQMPPVKKPWDIARSHVLATDDIAMFDDSSDCRYVFTDITYGLPLRVGQFLFITVVTVYKKPSCR